MDEVDGRGGLFLKSAEVASIAGINVEDVVLGKTANDVTTKIMWGDCVCPSVFFKCQAHYWWDSFWCVQSQLLLKACKLL